MERRVASVLLQGRSARKARFEMWRCLALHPSDFCPKGKKKEGDPGASSFRERFRLAFWIWLFEM
jgi:hypothetical protein